MLTQLEVFTDGIPAPLLPIQDQDASKDFIQIKEIEGLGPVTANVNTTQYGSLDGEIFTGSNTPKRNIVITFKLNPDWVTQTYESLRQILYSYFMPENLVTLRFTSTHLPPVEIDGIVEADTPDFFSNDPECQISIICPQPYFTAIAASVLTGVTTGLTDTENIPVRYEGSTPVGFVMTFTLPDGADQHLSDELRIISNLPTPKLSLMYPVNINSNQIIEFSSVQGDKHIRSIAKDTGLYTSILQSWLPGSTWWLLRQGLNNIQVLSKYPGLNWSMQYFARYGGL